MTDAAFLFGPLGYMQDLGPVRPGVTRSADRPRGELVTVGGVRWAQKAKFAPRTWALEYGWQTPDVVRLLQAAAQGVLKDCWLYDVAGARANMLPAHLVAGNGNPVLVGQATTAPTEVRRNLCINPRGVNAFTPYNGTALTITPNVTVTGNPDGFTTANRFSWTSSQTTEPGVTLLGSVVSGTTYTVSAWVYAETLAAALLAFAQSGGTTKTVSAVVGQWVKASWTFTASGTGKIGLRYGGGSAGSILVTGVLIEAASTVGIYFDGNTASSGDTTYAWTGVAHTSASVQMVGTATTVTTGVPLGALLPSQQVQVPVLAGRTYTISAWSAHATGSTVFTRKLGTAATFNVPAGAGSGVRQTAVTITPATSDTLTITVAATLDVSGLRIHEGTADGAWYPGHGTPCRVDVIDPETTLQLVTSGQGLSDYQVTLQEVGIPGVI